MVNFKVSNRNAKNTFTDRAKEVRDRYRRNYREKYGRNIDEEMSDIDSNTYFWDGHLDDDKENIPPTEIIVIEDDDNRAPSIDITAIEEDAMDPSQDAQRW